MGGLGVGFVIRMLEGNEKFNFTPELGLRGGPYIDGSGSFSLIREMMNVKLAVEVTTLPIV